MSDWVQKLEKRIDTKATKLDCWSVGAIYMAIGGSSPASMFRGSWTQIVGKYIRAKKSSQDSGSTGGNNNVTLQPANILTLTMQIGLCDDGYVGMESATYSGYTSDRSAQKGYVNSTLVRYYNSSVKAFTAMPEYINVNCWQRVS